MVNVGTACGRPRFLGIRSGDRGQARCRL